MIESRFIELFKLGLKPIPLIWNEATKSADSHCIEHGKVTEENYTEATFSTFIADVSKSNGIALKLFPPFGCIDFDLKNTEDKSIYDVWLQAVASQNDNILSKICIEKTRNGGYHVYIKHKNISSKVSLARAEQGEEVIALYTGGPLSYCDPTPGYDMFHNEFEDLAELTNDEFDILTSCAMAFDKYVAVEKKSVNIITEYPSEYENICLQFDKGISDEAFEIIVNETGLFRCKDYKYNKKDKFIAFLRKGSKAAYSAKVYFNTKNLQIFSSSIKGFPCFNDRQSKDDTSWNLSPSRILYYQCDRDWTQTIETLKLVAESADIELVYQEPVTNRDITPADRLRFPYDVFPDSILNFISHQNIQHEYLAASALVAVSSIIGNSRSLFASSDYVVKPILYLAIVAPPGASKTPALKSIFKPVETFDSHSYKDYQKEKLNYKSKLSDYKNQKKGDGIEEPEHPIMKQILIKDSTIEMVVKILSFNKQGCCILADELSGFMKRMNRYGENDDVQKWLEMWSGSPILLQRVSRDENKVESPFCSIIGGIQPGVLESLSSNENEHNGFYHRFLFCYPEPQLKKDWGSTGVPFAVKEGMYDLFQEILESRNGEFYYKLSEDANSMYAEWFNNKNKKYNYAQSDNVKGIIAKYQDYCLRFSLIIQIMHDPSASTDLVSQTSMERAIRLTEYFLGNMHKSMKILAPVSPTDKLPDQLSTFYKSLPPVFSAQTAVTIAGNFNIKDNYCRVMLRRWSEKKDQLLVKSGEQKNSTYEKLF